MIEVISPGPLATVQDLGRPGLAALGVGVSGAADLTSLRLANRLVGNPEGAAAIELTFGGLAARFHADARVALAGASCDVTLDEHPQAMHAPFQVPEGATLRVAAPATGVRTYVAVRGGIDVPPVLGSRATDTLARLGPERIVRGTRLPIGREHGLMPGIDVAPVPDPGEDPVLRVLLGPRDDWFTPVAVATLLSSAYVVTAESDRVGIRLDGPPLRRRAERELPSEAVVTGALQVPPDGRPVLFLADHPVTGGYPVMAVVLAGDVPLAAQARPGTTVRFRPA